MIPGGTSVWVFVEERVDDGCAGAGGGPGGKADGGRSSGVDGGVRGPVAPATIACLRKVVIWSLYASFRSEMSLRPFLSSHGQPKVKLHDGRIIVIFLYFTKIIALTLVLSGLAYLDIYPGCGLHFHVWQDTAHHGPWPIAVEEVDKRQLEAGLRSDVERYFLEMTWAVDVD